MGHSGSIGYLVDSYLVACASAALMLFFRKRGGNGSAPACSYSLRQAHASH